MLATGQSFVVVDDDEHAQTWVFNIEKIAWIDAKDSKTKIGFVGGGEVELDAQHAAVGELMAVVRGRRINIRKKAATKARRRVVRSSPLSI